jgi:alpha/beta hydrolase fold
LVVVGSFAAGLVAALVVVGAPLIEADEIALTGGILLAFAFGWALLAVLSVRVSDQPQRRAAAPAVFFGLVGGLMLIWHRGLVLDVLGWVWPPALLGLVVLMMIGAHRRLRSRTRRWLVYPLLAVLTLASLGGGYEAVQESIDALHPVGGELIDVGGHRLYLHCAGSGSPTVVLEPGLGEASSVMGWIAPAVAADSRVCVYNRAGRGWREAAGPLDGAQTADDLHTLLGRAHVPDPYVLAGHSFGGLYILAFAAHYPDEVAGMVLLDSTSPDGSAQAPSTDTGSYDLAVASPRWYQLQLISA